MFGSDQFNFETPNVIDPGDLPPSQPTRQRTSSSQSHTASTHEDGNSSASSSDGSNDHNEAYQSERGSTARLLRDIDDLDLTPTDPPSAKTRPYDPYGDEDDEERGGHSLPSVEEARLYATRLLVSSDSDSPNRRGRDAGGKPKKLTPPSPFKRTIQLDAPSSSHLVRKRFMRVLFRVGVVLAVLGAAMGIGIAFGRAKRNRAAGGISTSTTGANPQINSDPLRQDAIVTFLANNDISSAEDLNTEGSPQALAAQWMASFDPLQVEVPDRLHSTTSSSSRFVQRYVLAVFFHSMNGKDSWKRDYNFLSATDECSWYEETILTDHVQEETALGVSCGADLTVRNLYMPSNGLRGSIPSEIAFLSQLDLLALPNNEVTGFIPEELATLTNLVYLDVKYNQLSGFLPEWIGDLDLLEVLGLANNELAGSVPPSFGTLGRLKTLSLDDNALTGSLDFAQHLTNLEYFWADRNLMTGTVDDDFFAQHYQLRELDLSFNNLRPSDSGVFPDHLLQHPTLRVLDLAETALGVTLPGQLDGVNNVLQYLSLRRCGLEGSIPDAIRNLQGLTHLDLFGNSHTGILPNEMGEMLNLNYLFLGNNQFTANQEFPPFLSQLIYLRELSMSSIQLSGLIPSWIRYLSELKLLDLSDNSLGGPIPQELWDLPKLSFLLLQENELTGTVPSEIQGADQLQIVSLYRNKLTNDDNYGNLDHFCDNNPDMDLLAVDCGLSCSDGCCSQGCCAEDDDDCFQGKVPTYLTWYEGMWEFNYTRASYAFDPAILAEAHVAQVIAVEDESEQGYYDEHGDYIYSNRRGNVDDSP